MNVSPTIAHHHPSSRHRRPGGRDGSRVLAAATGHRLPIDLFQIHRPDPNTDIDETLAALTDLVQQGKVRYIGSSSFSAGQVVDATRRAIAAPALHPSDESRRVDAFGRALENRPGRTRGGA